MLWKMPGISSQMNKLVAILGDCHFGLGSEVFLDSQIRFHSQQFIPYLIENNIKKLILEGDVFDSRKAVDSMVMNKILSLFALYKKHDIEIIIIIGNHDSYLKNSNDFHSLKAFELFDNVKVYTEISETNIYGRPFLLVPWLPNTDVYRDFVTTNILDHIDVQIGHFDSIGTKMSGYQNSEVGLDRDFINRFTLTMSGHYHSFSVYENNGHELCYNGTPYQLNRGDAGEDRGFWILNCEDLSKAFVLNTTSIKFESVTYPETFTEEKIRNNIVDLHVNESNIDVDELENYKDRLRSFNPISITPRIIPKVENGVDSKDIKFVSLRQLFDDYVEKIEIEDDIKAGVKTKVNELFESFYSEG